MPSSNQLNPIPYGEIRIRDGILRERREHARGRYLADCGRICGTSRKSKDTIEEMWKK